MLARTALLLLLSGLLFCHRAALAQQPPSANPAPVPPSSAAPVPAPDRIAQMRTDLEQMESLMNNMQSEINFLRDQNLQILLNTNVRMWTILIRDLRQQLDDEEQRRVLESAPAKPKLAKPQELSPQLQNHSKILKINNLSACQDLQDTVKVVQRRILQQDFALALPVGDRDSDP